MSDDLCFLFDEAEDDQPDEERRGGHRGRRRGGRRGPSAGSRDRGWGSEVNYNQSDSRPEDRDGRHLRRYMSAENLNSVHRGHRGHRDERWGVRDRGFGGRGRGQDGFGGGGRGRYDDQREGRGGRGGRGGVGGPRPFQIRHFLEITDPVDAVLKLTSKLQPFKEYVESESIPTNETSEVLRVLATVLDCDMQRESVLRILEVVCSSRFLDTHLLSLLMQLESAHADREFFESQLTRVQEDVERMCKLISHICSRLPSHASKCQLLLVMLSTQSGVMATVRKHPNLEEELRQLMSRCQNNMKMAQDTAAQKQQAKNRRGPSEDDEIPPDDFTKLPIFPEGQDMEWSEKPFLRANKTEGAYKDVSHYLDVQFRLLREDYIRPLRNGIGEYQRMKQRGEDYKKNSYLRLYYNVKVIGLACTDSLEHRIQFDNSHLKNVRWESSKRLLFGSLVCLSRDDFQNIYFAVVTNRDKKDIADGIIQVRFQNAFEDIMDSSSGDIFIMAETTAYFEAYRHVLEGLQEMKSTFPLARYIVECKMEIKPPKYLLSSAFGTTLNIGSLLKTESGVDPKIPALLTTRWPLLESTFFNQSQYDAVKTALTKELAIIQGPPGTGKTYVGLKVARVLLENRHVWTDNKNDKAMLVVCYTNHALDQFLEGMLEFCPEGIVRVGSRCKNEVLEKFNLKRIRSQIRREKKVNIDIRNSINDCFRGLCVIRERVERVSATMEATTKGIVGEKAMKAMMSEEHFASLAYEKSNLVQPKSFMINWLTEVMLAEPDHEVGALGSYRNFEQELTQQILERADVKHKLRVETSQIPFLHPKTRVQLYRVWLEKVRLALPLEIARSTDARKKHQLAAWCDKCDKEILPDSLLRIVMDSNVYSAITQTSPQSTAQQTDWSVKTWLGFSPDVKVMQDVLDQLQGEEDDDEGNDVEEKPNVEEDAEYLQRERQLDDDDDDLFNFDRQSTYTHALKDAISAQGIVTAFAKVSCQDVDGWEIPKEQRKRQEKRLQFLLKSSQPMSEKEASTITNVWNLRLNIKDRVRLYLYWLQRYQTSLKESIKADADLYEKESARLRELKLGEDLNIMRNKLVIGMTTTGAARYRKVLREIGCPIVLLEEAAEVLEAHVVTTLHESCQHLILIGDHQQLRPSPTVYELSRDYHLDISLFERLVRNKLHHTTLALQHRMRPEIASLVRHVYPDLRDHVSTTGRQHVRGVKHDVFLVHHEIAETQQTETSSKLNEHEADFSLSLCRYLLQQGYTTSQITLLTAYSGQVFALKSRMKNEGEFFKGMRVTAVDNYQGEENDIIVLSLVRSNEEGNVGFLGTDNRVCVALSRARDGLYAIGNFKILVGNSELWKNIVKTAKSNQQLGNGLILRCENHPGTETKVSRKEDFKNVPEGGCLKPCTFRLSCGHVCERLCHGYDTDHAKFQCTKVCGRPLCPQGHLCAKRCYEPCGKCVFKVEKVIPMCGHKALIECHKDPHTWRCSTRCDGRLEQCGHQCTGKCAECKDRRSHVPCTEEVDRLWPCGHLVKAPCRATPANCPCPRACDVMLRCGHACKGTCGECLGGRVHKACGEPCGKLLPGCGHKCNLPCGSQCLPCREKKCRTSCKHSNCSSACGEPCKPCDERCPWRCPHKECDSFCRNPCQPCTLRCLKELHCGHVCLGFCGETCLCYDCESEMFVRLVVLGLISEEESKKVDKTTPLIKLPTCKHIFRADALDGYVEKRQKQLAPGKFLKCPACTQPLRDWDCWRYHGKLRLIRVEQEKAKEKLKVSAFVTQQVQLKVFQSMDLLTSTSRDLHSFASTCSRRMIETGSLDVNKWFALTNQIKLTRVIEMIDQLFLNTRVGQMVKREVVSEIQEDVEALKRIVLPPMDMLSEQRLREMRSEARRVTYIALLACCQGATVYDVTDSLASLEKEADRLLQVLKTKTEGHIPVAECDNLIKEWRSKNSFYKSQTEMLDLSIFEASADQVSKM